MMFLYDPKEAILAAHSLVSIGPLEYTPGADLVSKGALCLYVCVCVHGAFW